MPAPDPAQLMAAVGRTVGEPVELLGATDRGESRSTYLMAGPSGDMVLKVSAADTSAVANQRRLVRVVDSLRRRGYPVPEYLGVGRLDDLVFTVQRRLPGETLEPGPGLPPDQALFEAVLDQLLTCIELQRDGGDLPDPPWPGWLVATISEGGDGYCLHETMRGRADTGALLDRLRAIAGRNWSSPPTSSDVMHFDLNPANILQREGRLSGVVDWNVPFAGALQGDRGFDVTTLLFYSYDLPATRGALWDLAVRTSGLSWAAVYLCHLSLRQVEWTRRHNPGSDEERRFLSIARQALDDCEEKGA